MAEIKKLRSSACFPLWLATCLCVLPLTLGNAFAADEHTLGTSSSSYPSKPITMVVAYAPGGQGDLLARLLSERLVSAYKQPMLIDNRPGVAGTVGTRIVAKAKGDGYTLLLGQTGEIVLNRVLIKELGYDPLKDLKPVVLVANAPLVLLTSAQGPIKSVQDLIRISQSSPGTLSFGSVGAGTPGHLAAAALLDGTKLDMVHIPYKGTGPAMTDLLGGQIDAMFNALIAATPYIKAGKVRALAVTASERLPDHPEIPTLNESVPGAVGDAWFGISAPAKTPPGVVERLLSLIHI